MIKIDKGIEIPPENRGRKAKYPFRDMEVGDSFFIPKKECASSGALQARGIKVLGTGTTTVRKVTEKGVYGFRIWRIK